VRHENFPRRNPQSGQYSVKNTPQRSRRRLQCHPRGTNEAAKPILHRAQLLLLPEGPGQSRRAARFRAIGSAPARTLLCLPIALEGAYGHTRLLSPEGAGLVSIKTSHTLNDSVASRPPLPRPLPEIETLKHSLCSLAQPRKRGPIRSKDPKLVL